MTEQNPHPIVVAVGHDPIDTALAFAAGEASRIGCGLHLVHVVHRVAQGPEAMLVAETDLERAGRQALNGAVERVRDLVAADVPVTSELRVGAVVPTLAEIVADARMIVLQHRDLAHLMRVVTRSVSSGVAAHARVPVVAVPSGWSPARTHGEQPTVTVGVDIPDRCEEVLRAAAAEAGSRGATLRVLHTWSFPSPYEDIVMSRTDDEQWADAGRCRDPAGPRHAGRRAGRRAARDRRAAHRRGGRPDRGQPHDGPAGAGSTRSGDPDRIAPRARCPGRAARGRLPGPARPTLAPASTGIPRTPPSRPPTSRERSPPDCPAMRVGLPAGPDPPAAQRPPRPHSGWWRS